MAADGAPFQSPLEPSSTDAETAPHLQDLIAVRLSRRGVLGGLAGLPLLSLATEAHAALPAPRLPSFTAIGENQTDTVTVPQGFTVQTLIGWGDALYEIDAGARDLNMMRAQQERRFGQNNDMLALFAERWSYPPQPVRGRMLLCANFEYFNPALMFPGVTDMRSFTPAHMEAMYASMGVGVVQVEQSGQGWRVIRDAAPRASAKNRRITPFTPVIFDGPAANHRWVRALAQAYNAANPAPRGHVACGTLANCAGGLTPWGTYLSAEENFDFYFYNSAADDAAAKAAADADPALASDAAVFGYALGRRQPTLRGAPLPIDMPQYDLAKSPSAAIAYGWVLEVDPHDPSWTPRKRTAMGRRKGENASTALTKDGRVAVYSGDDQANEFVYKFVSRRRFNPRRRTANRDLLSEGALYAARLEADGSGRWIKLDLATANAAARNANRPLFADDGELMIRAREAARLLGATPMDRPEDIEALHDPRWVGLGPVLIVCTNNRNPKEASPGNPRRGPGASGNLTGHIVRFDEAGGDCGALTFAWDIFAMGGDPAAMEVTAPDGRKVSTDVTIAGAPTISGDRFACPDNLVVDSALNVWISTDGNDGVFPCNDSVLVTSAAQTGARTMKRFLVGPVGAEICGPLLAPDETAFLCAIQHPGENDLAGKGVADLRMAGQPAPSSFPDGAGAFPRSAIVVVTRTDGGKVTG